VVEIGRTARGTWGRRVGFAGVIAFALGLMVALPSAVAAAPVLTLKAPFTGTNYSQEQGSFGGCGGNASWARTPSFNLTTGHAYVTAQSKTPACKHSSAYTDAYAEAEFESASFILTSGHHVIKVKWLASYSIHLVATPSGGGTAFADSDVYAYAYVYDETNYSYHDQTYSTAYYNSTTSGSLVKTLNGVHLINYVNGTFAAGHLYEIIVFFEVDAQTNVSAGTSTASALTNAGTSGKMGTLESITAS
jgi:hypothetical protein